MTPQFTTPCFIRKNTPELRAKLREIGWRIGITAIFREYGYLCTDIMDNEVYAFIPTKEGINVPGYIDCGTNEALFLDLAAMRSDTDKWQWFIFTDDIFEATRDENNADTGGRYKKHSEGDFVYCNYDDVRSSNVRKATAQEIIEWHKLKGETK